MILRVLIDGYSLVVLAAVVLSWIRLDPDHPVVKIVDALTEPVLGPIRRILPDFGGIDFSPMILLVVLRFLGGLLGR
jgi:YggT family protein